MKVIQLYKPVPIPELKDILHPVKSVKAIIKCITERVKTSALCNDVLCYDVLVIEDYEEWEKRINRCKNSNKSN